MLQGIIIVMDKNKTRSRKVCTEEEWRKQARCDVPHDPETDKWFEKNESRQEGDGAGIIIIIGELSSASVTIRFPKAGS